MTQFDPRNITMMMDLYELTMANGYFTDKQEDKSSRVTFDVFYRKNPDGGGFSIFAGLEQVIEYIENLHFSAGDIDYLRSLKLFDEKFLQYLTDYHFTGDVLALQEGTIMYPEEPILTVTAPIIDAQLVETAILAEINHQSLIATKTRRIVRSAKGAVYRILVRAVRTISMQPSMVHVQPILAVRTGLQPCWPDSCSIFR